MSRQENQKARNAIKKLNEIRHSQEKKIDILCNDMVDAHREFVKQLKDSNFAIGFYESILGQNDIQALTNISAGFIRDNFASSNVATFLLDEDGFQLHMADDTKPIDVDKLRLENSFTDEIVTKICRSNTICSFEEMLQMGLIINIKEPNRISATALPLGRFGKAVGFILIYRNEDNKFTEDELQKLRSITPGLYRAIEAARQATQTTEI